MDTKTQIFIERAEKVHEEKYDYTRTVYVQVPSKLTISCKKHGDFDQIADRHLRESIPFP
jgi:transcriptional regulator